ncbi:indolepyruvate ferredoxin oxidoreductase family protein [Streptomyces albipurpureus]|uniref:Indolepyruvate ferredoxin oxidoreductase family protein n=1 Tax=Streptomyces albipurpureus TaxID=2897419 RepID=A0ABT0UKN1_9ACTN|nr:indolepyruvate ferredoxin oxidoreductase family protein [Streptomyces sp. CWNU-1]MCM2388165.1 indolepyruvate ferredoxin oxidoreductase family protein [Streptomyces sp. CWNU-1]
MAHQDAQLRNDHRYGAEGKTVQLTGIQALVRLPLDQRRADQRAQLATAGFISGYEGSPLAGYDLELARQQAHLDELDIVFRPGVNEELAATAVQGSQLAAAFPDRRFEGVTGYWYGKSPGLDRAADAMRHNNLMGTHPLGGAIALVGDDPAAKSSTVPGASEQLLADLGVPTLYPADSQDVLDLGLHAVAISRASGLWVALKIATNVADGSSSVQVGPDRIVPASPELLLEGKPFRHAPGSKLLQPHITPLEESRDGIRLEVSRQYAAANTLNRQECSSADDRIGILAAGKTFLDVRQALRTLGLDDAELNRRGVRLLRVGMIYPLESAAIRQFATGLREIIVVEEKRPFLEGAVRDLLYGRPNAPAVIGKRLPDGRPLFPPSGELDPDSVAEGLAIRLIAHDEFPSVRQWQQARRPQRARIDLPLLTRTPYFCSGCPHNASTKPPEGSLVGAGIGCHAMVLVMDEQQTGVVSGLTQMGGEGAQWIGMSPFLERDHLLQNLGDGTFHHSGSLAVRAAVAGGINITYKLLYNSAVAMTGGQQPTGVMSVPEITRALVAEGVKRIIVTTEEPRRYRRVKLAGGAQVWHRDRLVEAQETLAKVAGVTVLIHDQECATELRRKRKRGMLPDPVQRVMINERVCEGCGDCGTKSNCLSVQPVETDFGRKTQIDQGSCNKDYSCLEGDCPSFLTIVPAPGHRPRIAPPLEADAVPPPRQRTALPAGGVHTTRITGIGGSGVVTLSQILVTAATTAGRQARSLDQTGLAQKGGAVVSDIKIVDGPVEVTGKAAEQECDLYLGCDLLVAADSRNLTVADPARTLAVVSTSRVPTGHMVRDTSVSFPSVEQTTELIVQATLPGEAVLLDARQLASTLLGDDQFANMLLTGAAFQSGALPIPAEAIEKAIILNGVKAEANLQAFRRGRQAIADPVALDRILLDLQGAPTAANPPPAAQELIAGVHAPSGSELARLVEVRTPDLIAYQSAAYARQYTEFVEHVRQTEAQRVPGTTRLAEAVARHLYKLMAYKDEYEVARLSLAPEVAASVRAQFGEQARISYRLHPPLLRALGMHKKITLGQWFNPILRALVLARRLRGSQFDVFGYAEVRRTERNLISEYRQSMQLILNALSQENYELAVATAKLPDGIRGYEKIKLESITQYRQQLSEHQKQMGLHAEEPGGTSRRRSKP